MNYQKAEVIHLIEELTSTFLSENKNPTLMDLVNARNSVLIALTFALVSIREVTRNYEIEEPPRLYKVLQETIEFLNKDLNK